MAESNYEECLIFSKTIEGQQADAVGVPILVTETGQFDDVARRFNLAGGHVVRFTAHPGGEYSVTQQYSDFFAEYPDPTSWDEHVAKSQYMATLTIAAGYLHEAPVGVVTNDGSCFADEICKAVMADQVLYEDLDDGHRDRIVVFDEQPDDVLPVYEHYAVLLGGRVGVIEERQGRTMRVVSLGGIELVLADYQGSPDGLFDLVASFSPPPTTHKTFQPVANNGALRLA